MASDRNSAILLPTWLIIILVSSTLAPLAEADGFSGEELLLPPSEHLMDLSTFVAEEGHPYLFMDEGEPVYSATSHLKRQWLEAGSPGRIDQVDDDETMGRASARSCDRLQEGDTVNVAAYGGGTVSTTVERATSSVAFMLQDGYTLSSTVLSNWEDDWTNTVYPTLTTYFGKDYGNGVPEPPDVDGNCQIMVAIIAIDGAYNIGGYFQPGYASTREIIFVDHGDAALSWSKVILAHEFEHLLHNAVDSQENAWIDEGAADMAAYLCFGAQSTLIGHLNSWTENSGIGVRWWDQRDGDYGAGFIFMLWLADHLGGGSAIRQLVTNTQTGAAGIEALAQSPPNNGGRVLGSTFEEVFANFTIAVTLDSDDGGIHGLSNIAMTELCAGSSAFCRVQPAASNSDWSTPWDSKGNTLDGWGVQVFKFEPGNSPGAPLSIRVTADENGMQGRLVTRAAADGLYTIHEMSFNNMVSTAMIPSFGNETDEIYVITWYGSNKGDCDYTSCGVYPTATLDIEAARITTPATLALDVPVKADRDDDGDDDTLAIPYTVTSSAFFETVEIEARAINSTGVVVDEFTTTLDAGGGVPSPGVMYWTPYATGDYTISFVMKDLVGDVMDQGSTTSEMVYNMQPFPNASVNSNASLTWIPLQFTGGGVDYWGLTDSNNSFPHADQPTSYLWDFGDGNVSSLKSPLRAYQQEGIFVANLTVQDQGGKWSPPYPILIGIGDELTPEVKIHDSSGSEVVSEVTVYTNQRIQLSSLQTFDNIPNTHLLFNWSWGDGDVEGGIGHTVVSHEWSEGGNGAGKSYDVSVSAWDGKFTGYHNFTVYVKNRLPRLIFEDDIVVETYTSMTMPDLFVDDDGELTAIDWQFIGGVALDDPDVARGSDFTSTSSSAWNPSAAWNTPGTKSVIVTVTDNDGGQASVNLEVLVKNQLPMADIETRDDSSRVIDFRQEDAMVGTIYTFDGRDSFDPDGSLEDSSILQFQWTFEDGTNSTKSQLSHSFSTPGQHSVTLIVIDEDGQASANRTIIIQVKNPTPLIEVRILDAWKDGEIVTLDTPRPEGFTPDSWSRTFDDQNRTHVSAGALLFFDSTGTRDGDSEFINKEVPFDTNDDQWNGLVEYTWDFGDGTPHSKESHPWHAFTIPGTFTVKLTVRDAFETGDTSSATFTVVVDAPPETAGISKASEVIAGELSIFHVNASDAETNRNHDIYRDTDIDDGSINDYDVQIPRELTIQWDMDDKTDEDLDGDFTNDWVFSDAGESSTRMTHIFEEVGETTIRVMVCDGMGVCVSETLTIEIQDSPEETPTLSDFNWADAQSWLADAGNESMTVLGLIMLVLLLGWLVMRTPADLDEEEAAEAAQAYDVQTVDNDGGIQGMDQHEPPPKPKILSKDERTSNNSGYVRPVRAKRR